ncbi:MAG: hypothetical protein CND37_04370 [Bacteroidetes bacterium MED-G20]|nr:MAG: hypothetical protein CND37_04370 [Bacteroidetes bacterium MED-G20]
MKIERFTVIDISFIAIVHIAGIIGIRFLPEYFLKASFVSILIPLGLYFYRASLKKKEWAPILIVYVITFFSEWIGVNYGWLFGSYSYGNSLGYKIGGVPVLIGLNWVLLALVSRQISSKLISNKWLVIFVSAILMVLIDLIIEPLSANLDFWYWKMGEIPFSNYRDWFLVAVLNQCLLSFVKANNKMFIWSLGYVGILVVFFASFYI